MPYDVAPERCEFSRNPLTYECLREDVLAMLAEVDEVSGDENLISLGLDSLKIMRLLSRWRKAGAGVTFADMVEEPTLNAWWRLVCRGTGAAGQRPSQHHWDDSGAPAVSSPFPLSDVQYAYWIGRKGDQSLGGVGCHAYMEFDGFSVCPKRLNQAWQALAATHPMLQAVFLGDGTQQLRGAGTADPVVVRNLRSLPEKAVEEVLARIREQLSHRLLPVEEGTCAGLSLSLLPEGKTRIHFDLDLLVADV